MNEELTGTLKVGMISDLKDDPQVEFTIDDEVINLGDIKVWKMQRVSFTYAT
jgi:hypothetical protein